MPSNVLGVVPHGNYLLQYNSYAFDPATTETEMIDCRPVPDSSGRTIKYVAAKLAVHSKVFQSAAQVTLGSTIDTTMESLERKLMSFGGALYYRDKGFGDFNINIPGGTKRDVAWGPKPTHFRAKPFADAYGWDIWWGVECMYPWCDAAKFENAIAEWNYQVFWDHDDGGYETRRILGHIEIPMTRVAQGDRFIRASADDYRELITPKCPDFFRPTTSYFNLSEDRRTLTFNFTFEQFPGPIPPPGVLKVEMSSGHANQAPSFSVWDWTLSAQYELIYGVPHEVAKGHFVAMADYLYDRILAEIKLGRLADPGKLQNNGDKDKDNRNKPGWFGRRRREAGRWVKDEGKDIAGIEKPADQRDGPTIYPYSFSSSNPNMFGKPKCAFTLVHKVAGTAGTLLTEGLWEKIPGGNDWNGWYKKAANVLGQRGITGNKFDPADDVIIDLCRVQNPTLKGRRPWNRKDPVVVHVASLTRPIDPNRTWIDLKIDIEEVQHDSVIVHKPLPEDRTLQSRGGGSTLRSNSFGSSNVFNKYIPPEDSLGTSGFQYSSGASSENISTISRQAANTYMVILHGEATRLGIPPNPIDLISIGGVPAVAANDPSLGDGYRSTTVAGPGVPIFIAVWQFRYLLPCAPGTNSKDADSGAPVFGPAKPAVQAQPNFQAAIGPRPRTDIGNVGNTQNGLRRF